MMMRLAREGGWHSGWACRQASPTTTTTRQRWRTIVWCAAGVVRERLAALGIALHTFKDTVVRQRGEVLTQAGKPYSVFTPYSRAWLAKVDDADLRPHEVQAHAGRLAPRPPGLDGEVPSLEALGFARTNLRELGIVPGTAGADALLRSFADRMERY